jgi:hypothetical protein
MTAAPSVSLAQAADKFPAEQKMSFRVGESQHLATADQTYRLTLIEVNDSRCPENVFCFWQGVGEAVFSLQQAGQKGSEKLILTTLDQEPFILDNLTVSLQDISPYPVAGEPQPNKTVTLLIQTQTESCDSLRQRFCTMEYEPTECVIGELAFTGNNRCSALIQAEYYFCEQGLDISLDELTCTSLRDHQR